MIRARCLDCDVVFNAHDYMSHFHEYHLNSVEGHTFCGQEVEVTRSATGFFRCPQCSNETIRDSRDFQVSCISIPVYPTDALNPTWSPTSGPAGPCRRREPHLRPFAPESPPRTFVNGLPNVLAQKKPRRLVWNLRTCRGRALLLRRQEASGSLEGETPVLQSESRVYYV